MIAVALVAAIMNIAFKYDCFPRRQGSVIMGMGLLAVVMLGLVHARHLPSHNAIHIYA